MKILISGATGLVGSQLVKELLLAGLDDLHILTRDVTQAQAKLPYPIHFFHWDPSADTIDPQALQGVEVVVHLAGESVAEGRWSLAKKKKLRDSRLWGTALLLKAMAQQEKPPQKLISASAIGIYGDRGEEELTRQSPPGESFLAKLCRDWEDLALNHTIPGMSAHCLRIGIVLAREGGALAQMLPPFKWGVAGPLGSGRQFMSWIHLEDLIQQLLFLIQNQPRHSIYNGVAPRPVSNREFTRTLGKILGRPTLFPVPAPLLKLIFGAKSSILLASQRVNSSEWEKEGFQFRYPTLEVALKDLLKFDLQGEGVLYTVQWLPQTREEIFPFFADEMNLEKITPPYLHFQVLGKDTPTIRAGTLIDYRLKLRGIPIRWRTRIHSFKQNESFIDEQLRGPYAKWHHTHTFTPLKGGTLMEDRVIYRLPLGLVGRCLGSHLVKNDVEKIFSFRRKVIAKIFAP